MPPTGYDLQLALASGPSWEMWRARATGQSDPILIKFGVGDPAESLHRLHREYEILRSLNCEGVPRPIQLEQGSTGGVLLLEDKAATRSLEQIDGPVPIERFLVLASRLARAVAEVHQSGVYHAALRPGNVLIGADDEVTLVGFDRATRIPQEQLPFESAYDLAVDALPFLSPEQTGRMNRPVDYRTDIYSLGMILRMVLTGRPAFRVSDTVGWIHAHVALQPTPLREHRPDIPESVDAILAKACAKSAEDRYQNAFTIIADLERAFRDDGAFQPASDRSGRLVLSPLLYGREQEAEALARAFDDVAGGDRHLALVAGYSGIGKTALVQETHRWLTKHGGTFVGGKFEQLQKATPYSAIRQAFGELLLLLAESDDRGEAIAQTLREELGPQLGVVAELLPELSLLVGEVSPAPPLPAGDAHERFRLVFQQFVGAVAGEGHPLVVFLDDLQWADVAGLELVEAIMSAENVTHLLLVGAYRDNEVGPQHPLSATMERMHTRGRVSTLHLKPLKLDHVADLVRDSFGKEEGTARLAETLYSKTEGNPFFTRQFLHELAAQELISFDFAEEQWRWDVAAVAETDVTRNVVDLMIHRVARLHEDDVEALQLASCIGTSFDLATLSAIARKPPHDLERSLFHAAALGLVTPLEGREWLEMGRDGGKLLNDNAAKVLFRFRHDRVQQAVYSLLDPGRIPAIRLALARTLLEREHSHEHLFEIAGHFRECIDLIEESERPRVAEIFARAGERAAAATAYGPAIDHFQAAIALSGGDASWERNPELAEVAFPRCGECQTLVGNIEEAERLFRSCLEHARSPLQRARTLTLMMEMFVSQGRLEEALRSLVDALAAFDVELTPANVAEVAQEAAERVAQARANRTAREIVRGEETTDPSTLALLDLLGRAIDTAYMNGRDWVVAVTSLATRIALERGIAVSTSMTFSTYGLVDAEPATLDGLARRAEYGHIGAAIADRFGAQDWVARSNVSNPQHIGQPFWEAVSGFEKASRAGWASNAVTWAAYAEVRRLFMMLSAGADLDRLDDERRIRQALVENANRVVASVCCDAVAELCSSLRGEATHPSRLGGNPERQRELEDRVQLFGPWAMCKWYGTQQLLGVVMGDHEQARRAADAIGPIRHALLGMGHEHLFHVLRALSAVHGWSSTPEPERTRRRAEVMEAAQQLGALRRANPDFEPSALIVEAVQAHLAGDLAVAIDLANEAARAARSCGQTFLSALAMEQAGGCARERGHASLARFYDREARASYDEWGARAKVEQLDRRLQSGIQGDATSLSRADVESLLKAVRAISGELRVETLTQRLLEVLLENGGAQRGLLALQRDHTLSLEAETLHDGGEARTTIQPRLMAEEPANAILERCRRTKQPVAIDDFDESRWSVPEARSALCLPILRKGDVVGVVYLENRLATHGFAREHSGVLSLLVGQVAVALENARLYRELSEEIAERIRTEDAIRAERDLTSKIIESSPIIVCGLRSDGTLAFINATGEKLAGRSSEAMAGLPWWTTIHPDQSQRLETLQDGLAHAGIVRDFELECVDPSGVRRVIEWSVVTHSGEESALRQICFGRDVTEIRDAEARRAHTEEALRQAQRLETVGTLAAGIAHDFNNVLVPMLGFADLLAAEVEGNEVAEGFVSEIISAGEKASRVVAQLMAVSRRHAPTTQLVVASEVVTEVCSLLSSSVGRSVEVSCEVERTPPILADPIQLHQALLNLGTNAGQAMPDGGEVSFRVWRHDEDQIAITVQDTGPGMSDEVQSRVFEPFFTTKPPGVGSGLGLWMVHNIVSAIGGTVTVDSALGRGTTFTLLLPVAPESSDPEPSESEGDEHVLLVDDEPAVLRALETSLTRLGYRVTAFERPARALEALREQPASFDIVVTDYNMPSLLGTVVTERVKEIRQDLPVVLFTGAARTDPERLGAAGVDVVLRKPLTGRQLGLVIRRCCDSS